MSSSGLACLDALPDTSIGDLEVLNLQTPYQLSVVEDRDVERHTDQSTRETNLRVKRDGDEAAATANHATEVFIDASSSCWPHAGRECGTRLRIKDLARVQSTRITARAAEIKRGRNPPLARGGRREAQTRAHPLRIHGTRGLEPATGGGQIGDGPASS